MFVPRISMKNSELIVLFPMEISDKSQFVMDIYRGKSALGNMMLCTIHKRIKPSFLISQYWNQTILIQSDFMKSLTITRFYCINELYNAQYAWHSSFWKWFEVCHSINHIQTSLMEEYVLQLFDENFIFCDQ